MRGVTPQRVTSRATREVVRTDRRWILISALVFSLTVVALFGGLALYRATGPHPEVTVLVRRVRGVARWIIPRQRRPPKWWW